MQLGSTLSETQKRNEIVSLRIRLQKLDISSKDAFFKEMADRSDLQWEDVVEDLVPVVNDSQVETFLVEVE
jgi:hypothetical protein